MLGRRRRTVIGAATAAAVLAFVGVVVAGGGDRDDELGSAPSAGSTTSSSSGSASSSTSPRRTTSTTDPPPTPTPTPTSASVPEPAPPAAVDQARLDSLQLPDGTCDEFVGAGLPRTLTGGVSTGASFEQIELVDWAAGDLDDDGVADAVARIGCASGGSGYGFEAVAVLASRSEPLRVAFAAFVPSHWELDLWPIEVHVGIVRLRVGSSTEADAHCCSTIDTELTLAFDGEGFVLVGQVVEDAGTASARLAADVNAGDEQAIDAAATPEVAAAVVALRASGGDLAVDDPPTCRRLADVDRVACVLRAADGSSIEVGWRHDDFFVRVADVVASGPA